MKGEATVSPFLLMNILLRWSPLCCLLVLFHCSTQRDNSSLSLVTVQDDLGRNVSLPQYPSRIVSLAPSLTETLFALGLDSAIAGVTNYCNVPQQAGTKPKVGGLTNPDYETIVRLRPDLIVMTFAGNSRKDYDALISLGLNVFVSNPEKLEDVYRSIVTLGYLCGKEAESKEVVKNMQVREAAAVRKASAFKPQRVLLLVSLHPLIAAGKGTFVDELLTKGNCENITHRAATAYPLLSREEVLSLQPDWIVGTDDIVHSIDEIVAAYPEWEKLAAIRKRHVAVVSADLISRPGPRIILGLEALVDAIHP